MAGSTCVKFAVLNVLIASFLPSVNALTFPITGRSQARENSLRKREDDSYDSYDVSPNSLLLYNGDNLQYYCKITIGGREIPVAIDTGSNDLWVNTKRTPIPETKNLSIEAGIAYGVGQVTGFLNTADVKIADFEIKDQVYLNPTELVSLEGSPGILGLGPGIRSLFRQKLVNETDIDGNPPIDRIFRQNLTTPNMITFLLSRDPSQDGLPIISLDGQMTIGTILPGYEEISESPKLPALVDQYMINQHWQSLLDSNGIVGPDGERIPTETGIQNVTDGKPDQLHVIFDTGFTFPQVPKAVADAIYGRIPGAEFIEKKGQLSNFWKIPCDYEVNISFVFSGIEYPIHPLDTNVMFNDTTINEVNCIGGFQQTLDNIANNAGFGALDVILGAGFMRNTYTLIDYGDFVLGSNDTTADPYIQLLSTYDAEEAHLDFVDARLGGVDTSAKQPALLSPDQAKQSSSGNTTTTELAGLSNKKVLSNDSDDKEFVEEESEEKEEEEKHDPIYKKTWFIGLVSAVGLLALGGLAFALWATFLRKRKSNVPSESSFAPVMSGARAYKQLKTNEGTALLNEGRSIPPTTHDTQYRYEEPQYETPGARRYND